MWWMLLVACGNGPAVETEPVVPEPAVAPEPGDAPAPAPAPASVAAGSCDLAPAYVSVEAQECGRGGARCHWRISFSNGRYEWKFSDVRDGGTYTCADGVVTGKGLDSEFVGHLTPEGLTWHGVAYEPVSPDTTGAAPAPAAPASGASVDLQELAADRAEAVACTTDADCAVSSLVDGSCCHLGCGPANAYNKTFLARLEAHQEAACSPAVVQCPAVACMRQEYFPKCREGACVAVKEPL